MKYSLPLPPLLFSKHSPSQNLWKVKQLEDEKLGEASPNLGSVDVHVTIPWNHGHGRVFRVHCSEATDPEHCRVQPTNSQHWLWQFGFGTFEKCRNSEMKGLPWLVKQLFKCGFKQFLIVWGQFWKTLQILHGCVLISACHPASGMYPGDRLYSPVR